MKRALVVCSLLLSVVLAAGCSSGVKESVPDVVDDVGTTGGCPAGCDDGNPCTDDLCTSAGECVNHVKMGAGCDDGNKCTMGDACNADGVCTGGQNLPCDDENTCTQDGCDPDTGCVFETVGDDMPCEDGNQCTQGEVCSGGICAGGLPKDCGSDDEVDCLTMVCDPADGDCKANVRPEGSPCKDGNACTEDDECDETGVCMPGKIKECEAQHLCKSAYCNENAKEGENPCVQELVVEGTPCDDDNECTSGETCQTDPDAPSMLACNGSGVDCDDDNECTSDSCDEKIGCIHVNNNASCSVDDSPCSTKGECADGICVGATGNPCKDDNPCTNDLCDAESGECAYEYNSEGCDDGDLCTTEDMCVQGTCTGQKVDCSQTGNPCLQPLCNPETGTCDLAQDEGTPCPDADLCNGSEFCLAGECVVGEPVVCSEDGNDCTEDVCVSETGQCGVPVENGLSCGEVNVCDGGASCQDGQCTQGEGIVCQDDDNQCTEDVCNPENGQCGIPLDNGSDCDDADMCTENDTCQDGTCQAGEPLVCDDGNVCTNDACVPPTGCEFLPNLDDCTDKDQCTDGDVCGAGECVPGPDLICDDQNECTENGCMAESGCSYQNVADDTSCGELPGWTCLAGQCHCVPDCEGKDCGSDGCGDVCGECGQGLACDEQAKCTCTPDCDGKDCGDDGCGGACGPCEIAKLCGGDTCIPWFVWSLTAGEGLPDYGSEMAVASDGSLYVAGGFESSQFDVGGGALENAQEGTADIFLVKLDPDGKHVWSKRFGGVENEHVYAIATDAADNVIVAGYYYGPSLGFGGAQLQNAGAPVNDIYIAKLDAGGNHVWSTSFGGPSHDTLTGLAVDWSGHIYATGAFASNEISLGGAMITNKGERDAYLAKYDSDGNHVWSMGLGGDNYDAGTSVACGPGGTVYIIGQFESKTMELGGAPLNNQGVGSRDLFVGAFTEEGQHIWSAGFGGTGDDHGGLLAVGPTGDLFLSALFKSALIDLGSGEFENTEAGTNDIVLGRFTPSGQHVWSKVISAVGEDYAESLQVDHLGNVYVAGTFVTTGLDLGGGVLVNAGSGKAEMFLGKLDANGDHLWSARYGGVAEDAGSALVVGGEIYLTGGFASAAIDFGGGAHENKGSYDAFVVRLGQPCVSGCTEKQCGADGCGGSCGVCLPGENCVLGVCMCAPDCLDRECGDDGCGGECGDCGQGLVCDDVGQCMCVPDCADHECGDDGCGGECGPCEGPQEVCVNHDCVCQPSCAGKECGADGCGSECGVCAQGQDCLGSLCQCPESISLDWELELGTSSPDTFRAIATAGDFIYAVGTTKAAKPLGIKDLWVVKTTLAGEVVWEAVAAGGNGQETDGYDVAATPDGGAVVVGDTFAGGVVNYDLLFAKFSPSGNLEWQHQMGGGAEDRGRAVAVVGEQIFVGGLTWSQGVGASDAWLIRTDLSGQDVAENLYGMGGHEELVAIDGTPDGGAILLGTTDSKPGTGVDYWAIRINSSGAIVWENSYGGTGSDYAMDVVAVDNSHFLLFGHTNSKGAGNWDYWAVAVCCNGSVVWDNTYGHGGWDLGNGATLAAGGGYALMGTREPGYTNKKWVVRISPDGDVLWEEEYDGHKYDYGEAILSLDDGSFVLAGLSTSAEGNAWEAWLARTSVECLP